MKYVSIDIETTGLNPETHQILSVGAVIEDTNNKKPYYRAPKFYAVIPRYCIVGHPMALHMNAELIGDIANYNEGRGSRLHSWVETQHDGVKTMEGVLETEQVLLEKLHSWLCENFSTSTTDKITITVAGKNFWGLDAPFLNKIRGFGHKIEFSKRSIDPATLFTDFQNDETLPNMAKCMERAGIPGEVTHNALQDAWDVVQVLRTKY